MKKWVINFVAVAVAIIALVLCFNHVIKTQSGKYEQQIEISDSIIKDLHEKNAFYENLIKQDSITIANNFIIINNLLKQKNQIATDLLKAQSIIKNYTSGEAINFFTEYSKTTNNKMLVEKKDTSLVITSESVKKVDSIFIEHKFHLDEIINLNEIVCLQSNSLNYYSKAIDNYNSIIDNKDSEINMLNNNAKANITKANEETKVYKSQRNIATIIAGGTIATVFIVTLVKLL